MNPYPFEVPVHNGFTAEVIKAAVGGAEHKIERLGTHTLVCFAKADEAGAFEALVETGRIKPADMLGDAPPIDDQRVIKNPKNRTTRL